jgi:DNA polymerase
MLDSRKALAQLYDEWKGCLRCPLGQKRESSYGKLVVGEGALGRIFFIGEGPGATEAEVGRPFIGRSGEVLRAAIMKLGLSEHSYISNVVACRSFGIKLDNQGKEMFRKDRRSGVMLPVIQDEAPPTTAVNACLARLYEEIYIVDPMFIVALGGEAAKAILRRPVKVTEKRGTMTQVDVPGVWSVPHRTSSGNWERRSRGQSHFPTEQNYVNYMMFITLHPAHILYKQADQSHGNPLQVFIEDMHMVADIYHRYLGVVYGETGARPGRLTPQDLLPSEEG